MPRPSWKARGSLGRIGLVAIALAVIPTRVGAEEAPGPWYYNWECAGVCERSVDRGREGPFATYEECDQARGTDLRRHDHTLYLCERPTSMGPIGWGGTLPPGDVGAAQVTGTSRPARIASIEVGVAAGAGWAATGGDGVASPGPATLGLEIETHTGRDAVGGTLMMGIQTTWLESPMLGPDPRTLLVLPLFVGIAITPKVYSRGSWSIRPDVGASLGGFITLGCGDCPGAVFDETTAFGYTLKAGVDIYTSPSSGFSLEALFPRWSLGSASPGDLLLESPEFLVRLSLIARPARP